ncbi:Crp/Fnr family transcriptional regulator [Streptomyces sp. NPDC020681]|uniref:Crp/Fnr family transcriptional regulator n=1 Tax=Streptomyces sp. NPDC020681 TaxID=3365083 RepID=UPI00378C8D10
MNRHRSNRVPFWSLLDDAARLELRRTGHLETFAPKEQLLQENELTDHLLVVRRGCVKVTALSADGYQAVLAIRNAGDLLGEQAGLDGGPRSATLTALTTVEALIMPASGFRRAAGDHPGIAAAMQQMLSARLRDADSQRTATGGEAIQARLAALLLELGERYGRRSDSGALLIALPLSQDDFAGLVLGSRRTVSRILEQWRANGWVTTGRNRLVVENPDALKQQCGEGS